MSYMQFKEGKSVSSGRHPRQVSIMFFNFSKYTAMQKIPTTAEVLWEKNYVNDVAYINIDLSKFEYLQ